jgi:hypothetical protein
MKLICLATLSALLAWSRVVAHVDLTAPPKTPEAASSVYSVRGGGVLGHGGKPRPAAGTPPLSLTLLSVTPRTRNGALTAELEVALTNSGDAPVAVPIGTDPVPLLASGARGRRYVVFVVTLQDGAHVGSATAASNDDHPDSVATLQPGDSVFYKLPLIAVSSDVAGGSLRKVGVSASFNRKVLDRGVDWTEPAGDSIKSENSLRLP